jgi:hypothetical protein
MADSGSEDWATRGLLSMVHSPASDGLADLLYRWYPVTVLGVFVLSALICSIQSSSTSEDAITPTIRGPGGKPLPATKRKKKHDYSRPLNWADLREIGPRAKLAFRSLAIITTLLVFLNAIAIGLHTWKANPDLFSRRGKLDWWCGEPMTVSDIQICLESLASLPAIFHADNSAEQRHCP